MGTPHISAERGDFAPTVLMPGDPLRAKYIADKFLTKVRQLTAVRNMLGFTGEYNSKPVSIMGSGMGIPSISIYSYELFTQYDVENIIRVGSCGALQERVKLRDLIIAVSASTDSNVNRQRFNGFDLAASADFGLLEKAVNFAREKSLPAHVGNIFSGDLFYNPNPAVFELFTKMGILGVEMEAAGLYGVAIELGKKALTVATVSDHILTGAALSAEERQVSFNEMIEVALSVLD